MHRANVKLNIKQDHKIDYSQYKIHFFYAIKQHVCFTVDAHPFSKRDKKRYKYIHTVPFFTHSLGAMCMYHALHSTNIPLGFY